jgi:hypothetical protein
MAARLRAGQLGFDLQQGQEICLFAIAARPAVVLTQPPVQWLPWALPTGVKRQGREGDHSPPTSAEVTNGGPIPSLPHMPSWHSA